MGRIARQVTMLGMLLVIPAWAHAQDGAIAGVVRDPSDAVLPGVLVEVSTPALIEKPARRPSTAEGNTASRPSRSAPTP
jgi:hypothetical protein